MKRGREEETEFEVSNTADCLMLLSRVGEFRRPEKLSPAASGRDFVCKTCGRKFSSFQALGGHRASHKKPRFGGEVLNGIRSPVKVKTHECPICGLDFPIGQALGGHMRRHRSGEGPVAAMASVMKKNGAAKRVFGLDLNLTPVENDLKLRLMNPIVNFF